MRALIGSALLERFGWRQVPPKEIEDVLAQQKRAGLGHQFAAARSPRLGQKLAADHVLVTNLMLVDDACRLKISLYAVESEVALSAASARSSCDMHDVEPTIDALVSSLAKESRNP